MSHVVPKVQDEVPYAAPDESPHREVTGTTVGSKRGLDVAFVGGSPLGGLAWDAVSVAQTSSVVETYSFRTGGLAGTLVATCTVTYSDASHDVLVSAVWT